MRTVVLLENGAVGKTHAVMNGGKVAVGDKVTVLVDLYGGPDRKNTFIEFGVVVEIITTRAEWNMRRGAYLRKLFFNEKVIARRKWVQEFEADLARKV